MTAWGNKLEEPLPQVVKLVPSTTLVLGLTESIITMTFMAQRYMR